MASLKADVSWQLKTPVQTLDAIKANKVPIASFIAASCGVMTGHPLDSLKTRMQNMNYSSLSACLSTTLRHKSFRSLYSGVIPPLVTTSFQKSIAFTVQDYIKKRFLSYTRQSQNSLGQCFIAGSFGGLAMSLIACPMELIKIQLQMSHIRGGPPVEKSTRNPFSRTLKSISNIVGENGLSSLYRGWKAQATREVIGLGIYFSSYEGFVRFLSPTGKRADAPSWAHFLCGGLSGMLIWSVIFPVDFVKSRFQYYLTTSSSHKSYSDIARMTLQTQGIKGFYNGIQPCLLRAFPVHSVIFLTYSTAEKWIEWW